MIFFFFIIIELISLCVLVITSWEMAAVKLLLVFSMHRVFADSLCLLLGELCWEQRHLRYGLLISPCSHAKFLFEWFKAILSFVQNLGLFHDPFE